MFALVCVRFGVSVELASGLVLLSTVLVAAMIDFQHGPIPDRLSVFLAVAGIGFSLVRGLAGLHDALWGAAIGGGTLYLIGMLGRWVLKRDSMGGGEIKLAAGIGLFLASWGMMNAVFLASVVGVAAGLGLRALGRLRPLAPAPFAPCLAVGAGVEVLHPLGLLP